MDGELQKALGEIQSAWAEYKKTNDQRLLEIEQKGKADPLLEEKLGKIDAEIDRLNGEITAAKRLPVPGKDGQTRTKEQAEHAKAYGQFLRKGREDGLRVLEAKAMSVGSDPDGGYFVPADTSGRMVKKIFETTPMRQIASVITISTDRLEGMLDLNEASCGWVAETGTRSETNTPQVGQYNIPVHELYAEPRMTQKLLDDAAFDVESWLADKVADKFSRTENAAYATGNGVGKPRGFASYPTAATADATRAWGTFEHVKSGANGDFASADPADKLFDLMYALKVAYRAGASWLMPRAVLAKVRKLKDANDQYLWQPGLQAGEPSLLLGSPVRDAEDLPALATDSLSLWYGDWKETYLIVDRIGIRVLRDPYTAKPYVKFYTTKRTGGEVLNTESAKAMKFAA